MALEFESLNDPSARGSVRSITQEGKRKCGSRSAQVVHTVVIGNEVLPDHSLEDKWYQWRMSDGNN